MSIRKIITISLALLMTYAQAGEVRIYDRYDDSRSEFIRYSLDESGTGVRFHRCQVISKEDNDLDCRRIGKKYSYSLDIFREEAQKQAKITKERGTFIGNLGEGALKGAAVGGAFMTAATTATIMTGGAAAPILGVSLVFTAITTTTGAIGNAVTKIDGGVSDKVHTIRIGQKLLVQRKGNYIFEVNHYDLFLKSLEAKISWL